MIFGEAKTEFEFAPTEFESSPTIFTFAKTVPFIGYIFESLKKHDNVQIYNQYSFPLGKRDF